MKTKTFWLNDWCGADKSVLEKLFGLKNKQLSDIDILLASYKEGDYSGYGFILFAIGQDFYEVNVSHDSECEFDGQWQPEETTIEALLYRLHRGNLGSAAAGENVFSAELKELLSSLMQ
ncbi:MAG: hypothetical protein OEY29_13315 [Gammaproteobacteria bacterium]|nr:hypothetical protein [Gammaproteobacteria bacterium]